MKLIFGSIILLFAMAVSGQTRKPVVSADDFSPAFGVLKGTIMYLDYTSGKPFTMPAHVTISRSAVNGNDIILGLAYPEEPKANGNDTLLISKEGTMINGGKLVSKRQLTDGSLEIITDQDGYDGNDHKKAILRHIYIISKTGFRNRKEVKFEGTDAWIVRNEFSFLR